MVNSAENDKTVEIENLTVHYGGKLALDNVSLFAKRGEILGVIGPANSGKTTFLKCINRTIDFSSDVKIQGLVRVGGVDVRKVRSVHDLRRKIDRRASEELVEKLAGERTTLNVKHYKFWEILLGHTRAHQHASET